ncbi:GMC family oxidoreductase [Streptomyces sp. WAC05374]|uniref:GMC family oxidoreductase n=1 Tax=Streptomyces sp. WAC05374 TaxID=2487420 RepID=UPI000F86F4FD|nr:GMC family oxidoreductase [Streptomyces sp. WAC05374]RST19229.1 GMC family oxidoreductase [Streptomyces sp. WAC05374]TDF50439.1 GMC family oxidoreductase [Streptomyces sp. WAC05374]TDF51806.1 GMC family oxidoreductase [Streptomyces sp. WAC05374]TDF60692.1 GMC family oxidoreductase [Streptomyces sp. WAC05374]
MTGIWGPGTPPVVTREQETYDADVAVIGSGAGGATLAWALASTGARVLVLERGGFLPREDANWSPDAVFGEGRYHNAGPWHTAEGRAFTPANHYYVGGTTKVYGAALPRLRESDFDATEQLEGASPAWPFRYADLEPYYCEAERLYRVHGQDGADPTAPPRSVPYPHPAVPHEPVIGELAAKLTAQGLHPFPIELGIDLGARGTCVRCGTCDAHPCRVGAKSDAETRALRPALRTGTVRLLTRTRAERLLTDPAGRRVTAVEAERGGRTIRVRAGTVVVSCGAINSAALLLRSGGAAHPDGLANGSGLVGRNLMVHNNSVLMAVDPRRRNPVTFQKTLAVNDHYHPLGNLQLMGKVHGAALAASHPRLPRRLLDAVAARSVDWWVMSEDLPDPDNRVLPGPRGGVVLRRRPTNTRAHRALVRRAAHMMRRAGHPLVFSRRMGVEATGHQCGTTVAGHDETRSVLDPYCRSHQVPNLYVVDGGFFPSSAAVNPTLTIAAQALRTAREGGVLP